MALFLMLIVVGAAMGETVLDLSHDLGPDSMTWPSNPRFKMSTILKGYYKPDIWVEGYHVAFSEHTTTHIDAPLHFQKDGWSVDKIPLSHFIGPAVVIDMTEKVATNNLAALSAEDVKSWVSQYGPIPNNSIVFVRTGWAKRYGNFLEYYGSSVDNDTSNLIFPGIGGDAATLLASYMYGPLRAVVGVGIDTGSLDPGNSKTFDTHRELTRHNIFLIENVANLEKLPVTGAEVTVMPIKIRGGSGGPARILARVPSPPVTEPVSAPITADSASTVALHCSLLVIMVLTVQLFQ